jgi:putative ATP-binding cassette transporter
VYGVGFINLLRFFFQQSRKMIFLSIFAGVLSGFSSAALLAVITSALKTHGRPTWALIGLFAGLCLLLPVSRYVSELLLNHLGQGALYGLRLTLSRQILASPLRLLEQIGTPRLMAALTDDIPTITNAILVVPLLCTNVAIVLGCLIYMGSLLPAMFGIVMAFLVLGVLAYQLPIIRAHNLFRRARRDNDAMLTHFRALTEGIKELKMHSWRREAFLTRVLQATASSFRSHSLAAIKIFTAAASCGQTLVFVVVGLTVLVLPSVLPISPLILTGYTLALIYLMTPLQNLMNTLPTLAKAETALRNVKDLGLSLAGDESEAAISVEPPPTTWKSLQLASVTHAYHRDDDTSDFVLGPLDLTFEPGQIVFITGGNGSGKTTFLKLLSGLYSPETGGIYLDDHLIASSTDKERYRQNFSVVFSDFYLFTHLIGLQRSRLDQQAAEYLAKLQLNHKVGIKNGQLSTIELSQGQRKRLALLTAYLEDRPIYIFDEWAADQDPYYKDIFYLQLLSELKQKQKTVFIISHDDKYYHVADRIITIRDGYVISDTKLRSSYTSHYAFSCCD